MFGESLKEDNMSHSLTVNNGNGEQRKAKINQHGPSPRFEPLASLSPETVSWLSFYDDDMSPVLLRSSYNSFPAEYDGSLLGNTEISGVFY
jgi:hypothetical protein